MDFDLKCLPIVEGLNLCEGIEDFKDQVDSGIFVDKSLFIEIVLSHRRSILITRPPRFGKTINMTMLKTFLEIPKPDIKVNPNSIYFKGGEKNNIKYEELKIASNKKIWSDFHGKYPVIYLSFKNIKPHGEDVFQSILQSLRDQIRSTYKEFIDIVDNYVETNGNINFKERFDSYSSGIITDIEIRSSILILGKIIYKIYDQKVFLLIDDYDRCITDILQESILINDNKQDTSESLGLSHQCVPLSH